MSRNLKQLIEDDGLGDLNGGPSLQDALGQPGWEGVPPEVVPRQQPDPSPVDAPPDATDAPDGPGSDPSEWAQGDQPAQPAPEPPPTVSAAPRPSQIDRLSQLQAQLAAARSSDDETNSRNQLSDDLYRVGTRQQLQPVKKADSAKGVLEDYGLEQQQKAEARKAALTDPSSDESKRARELLKGLPIGQRLSKSGVNLDSLTAGDIPGLDKLLALSPKDPKPEEPSLSKERLSQAALDDKRGASLAAEQKHKGDRRDPNSAISAEARDLFAATAVGAKMREKLGEERWKQISAESIPGADHLLAAAEAEKKAADKSEGGKAVAAAAAEGNKIPFGEGVFQLRPGAAVDRQVKHKAVEAAMNFSSAYEGAGALETALHEWAANPGSQEARDKVLVAGRLTSGALNTAYGQGAMSMDEAQQMATVLGMKTFSPDGVKAFFESIAGDPAAAGATAARKARAVKEAIRTLVTGKLKAANYEWHGGQSKGEPKDGKTQKAHPPSPGAGFTRGTVDGKPGWINEEAGEWEPD